MGFLPLSFVFTTRAQRILAYPFAYKVVDELWTKYYSFSFHAVYRLPKRYSFTFKSAVLHAVIEDELSTNRLVVKPVRIEDTLMMQKRVAVESYLAHHIQMNAVKSMDITLEANMSMNRIRTEATQLTEPQKMQLYKIVSARFDNMHKADIIRIVEGYLQRHQVLSRTQIHSLAIQEQSVMNRPIERELQIEQADITTTSTTSMMTLDAAAAFTTSTMESAYVDDTSTFAKKDFVEAVIEKHEHSERLKTQKMTIDIEKHAIKGAAETTIENRTAATSISTTPTVITADDRLRRLNIYTVHTDNETRGQRDVHELGMLDVPERMGKMIEEAAIIEEGEFSQRIIERNTELMQSEEAYRHGVHVSTVDMSNANTRTVIVKAVQDMNMHSNRLPIHRTTLYRPANVVKLPTLNTHVNEADTASRKHYLATQIAQSAQATRTSVSDIQLAQVLLTSRQPLFLAKIEQAQRAFLQEVFETFVDEADMATSLEVFLTDVIEHVDATSLEVFLTDVDEPDFGVSIKEKKKKLIWLISGRPSWIMQWNQWKKTR